MSYKLKNWSVVQSPFANPYLPPEFIHIHLAGEIYGRPERFADGKHVTTSRVETVNGRFITTHSGSVYELVGDPDPNYLKFLKEIGEEYDKDNPIKIIDKSKDWN